MINDDIEACSQEKELSLYSPYAIFALISALVMFLVLYSLFQFSMGGADSVMINNIRSYLIPLYFYNFIIGLFCILGILDAMYKKKKGLCLSLLSLMAVLFYLYYLCFLFLNFN